MPKLPALEARRRVGKRLRELLRQQESKRGFLIAFEGPDGSGKTTQRKLLTGWLRNEGHEVITTKWNSSPLISPLVKVRKAARAFSPEEFCLLHAVDFRHRMETVILPALWQGKMVVADRYLFTALARDAARGLELSWLLNVFHPLLWPDVVYYFAVSPETSARRIAATRLPKYYEAGQDVTHLDDPVESYKQFISRTIHEYQQLAVIFEFVTVDAEQSIYDQHKMIRELFEQKRKRSWAEWNIEPVLDWLGRKLDTPEVQLGL